ncbi:NAD-dependent epimerase/dehydratase family protein [Duganella sp. FT50W]|uniref:NAD-dependent epimerase/dehydratase family protein n=1 Tax=Duganella lactea TaxID=2692173 RepID=A0A6L8MR61_9BURK|nr:NAD-dependent epimerase/dehydratase family protein [Duganella lactea]
MGIKVIACDNFNDYYSQQLKQDRVGAMLAPRDIVCHAVELSDAEQVSALFDEHQPGMVVHLAAQAGVRHSLKNPALYVKANMVAFGNVLDECRKCAVRHLLYASSSSVYGANAKVPFHEDDRTDEPISLYAATKKSDELMAYSYSHLYGLPATGMRFFRVYGPWGRPDMAYFSFTQKILKGEPIPVYANGELLRDFTYIDDVVEGVVRLLFKPQVASSGHYPHSVFNIGNQTPVQVREFIGILERVLGTKANLEFFPMQPGDVPATFADISRLRDWIDFTPHTPLEQGLNKFRDWYQTWLEQA